MFNRDKCFLLIMFYRLNAIFQFHKGCGILNYRSEEPLFFELQRIDSGLGIIIFHKMSPRTLC